MKILEEKDALAVVPRNAATVLILRDSDHGPEVLMVRRSPSASFMPNAYVFPGGAVDALDQDVLTDETLEQIQARFGKTLGLGNAAKAFAVATVRECLEECGDRKSVV